MIMIVAQTHFTPKDFYSIMRKIFIYLLLFSSFCATAQVNTRITALNASDSSVLNNVRVSVELIAVKQKRITLFTDSTGNCNLQLASAGPYYLSLYAPGFKTFTTKIAQNSPVLFIYLQPLIYDGEEVTVSATRAGEMIPGTYTVLSKKELANRNFGQDIPVLLQNIPSAVTSSDAGTGIGYTGIRIRGIDPTRINVTINGVPLNDAESQSVFWVNMPDFASGVENIQVQRGVGTTSGGTGAFGAAINIKTDKFSETPYAYISLATGSFKTNRQTLKIGSGRLNSDWYMEARLSWIKSDGFVDRASSNLKSWYFTTGKKTKKSLFQVNVFSGSEKTYQAWNGVPAVKFNIDSAGIDSFIAWQWYDSAAASNLRLSDRNKYNYYTYANETDNYKQTHLQVVYNRSLKKNSSINAVLHGTLGKGYYENYERKTDVSGYLDTPLISNGQRVDFADLIHQRWLDNQFVGALFSYQSKNARTENILGGGFNVYKGKHFGEVIWHEFMDDNAKDITYYSNKSLKTDANVYCKLHYAVNSRISAFSDLQVRSVYYQWFGPDNTGISANQHTDYLFFNPKAGIKFQKSTKESMYLTIGRASREPVRDDFINADRKNIPKPEFMNNVEGAYQGSRGDWKYTVTGFYMGYKDQLALTGKINDVGGYTRINIPNSYRAGLEVEASVDIANWINWSFNVAFSQNKIKEFTEYVDDYTQGGQKAYYWKNTDMALSPNRVVGSQLTVKFSKAFKVLFLTKYVGRQYLDNTQNERRSLEPYLLNDIVLHFNPKIKMFKSFGMGLMVNNIGNRIYASNGYSYSGIIHGHRRDFSFVYPQAGTNVMVKLDLGF